MTGEKSQCSKLTPRRRNFQQARVTLNIAVNGRRLAKISTILYTIKLDLEQLFSCVIEMWMY